MKKPSKSANQIRGVFLALYVCTVALVLALLYFIPVQLGATDVGSPVTTHGNPSVSFWVTDYLNWHQKERPRPTARRLIYSTVNAGLGDNISGLLRTFAFAVLTRRVLVFRWKKPFSLRTVVSQEALEQFEYNPAIDRPNGTAVRSFHHLRMDKNEFYSTLRGPELVVQFSCGPSPLIHDVLPILRGEHLARVKIPPFNQAAIRKVARTLFEPSVQASLQHEEALNEFGLCTASGTEVCPNFERLSNSSRKHARQYIGVHARLGIGTSELSNKRFRGMLENQQEIAACFARAAQRIAMDHVGDAHPLVFLATDTPSFRTVFRDVMKSVFPKGTVFWIDLPVHHYRSLRRHREGLFQFEHLFREVRLLGDAAHILSFDSGFSYSANWLGSALQLHVLSHHQCGVH